MSALNCLNDMTVQKEFKKSYILTYSLSVVDEIFEKFTHFNKILYIYNVSLAIVLSGLFRQLYNIKTPEENDMHTGKRKETRGI